MSEFYDYSFLCHHGIKGMKWGVRRYQNEDGSLTSAGKERYSTSKGKIPTARPKTVTDNGTGVKKREAVKIKEKYRLRDWRSRGGSRYTPEYAEFNEKIVNGGGRKGSVGSCNGIAFYAEGINLKSAKEANQYLAKYGIGIDQLYLITSIAHTRGITSLTIDPAGYTPGIYTSMFKELRGNTDTAENADNYYTDTVFPAVNVPEQTPDFQDIIVPSNNSYKPTSVAGALGAIAGATVASITTPEAREAIAKGVKKVKSIIKSIKKKIKDVVDPPVTVTNTWSIAGDPNTYTDSFTMNKKKVKHSMNFNEQNYLCHYGIKGMKWGIRRYQNPDGSLTAEGIQRYGSKKGLAKHINAENKKAEKLERMALVTEYAYDRASKRHAKTMEKLKKSAAKGKFNERLVKKLGDQTIAKSELEERKNAARSAAEEHYNSLVNEFGKDAVSKISKDGVHRGDMMVSSYLAGGVAGIAIASLFTSGDNPGPAHYGVRSDAKALEKAAQKRAKGVTQIQSKQQSSEPEPSYKTVSNGKTKVRIASSGNEKEDKALANNISTINKNATKKFVDDNIEYLQKRYPEKTKSQLYNSFEIDSIADNGVVDIKAKEGSGLGNIGYPYVEMDRKTGKMYRGGWDD
jgi:hypothetical protein